MQVLLLLILAHWSQCLPTDDLEAGQYGPVFSLDFKHFPLRKCHCQANEYWDKTTKLCFPAVTTVDFITNYHPEVLERIQTTEFSDLFVSDVTCEDSVPFEIYGSSFNAPNTVYHKQSGDSFQRFCIEHVKNETGGIVTVATVCIPRLTIPSCCLDNQVFNNITMQCETSFNGTFSPQVHIGDTILEEASITPYFQDMPRCHLPGIIRKMLRGDRQHLSGSLHYQQSHVMLIEWQTLADISVPSSVKLPIDYCVAMDQNGQYAAYIWDEWAFEWCVNDTFAASMDLINQCDQAMYWLLLPMLILSSLCLIVILVLHAVLVELRQSLGSKITICHVASLLAGFLVLIVLHAPVKFNCKVFGPIVQVCFLATFFWLNVMCFDIWWKLSRTSPASETNVASQQRKFFKYSIYAWGCPLLIGMVTVLMDNIPELQDNPNLILPGFGQQNCWFADSSATFAYYFGVIAVLMVVNLYFFVSVFVILVKANCIYNQVLRDDVRSSKRSWIYFKIFGVMGLTWICEFLSWQEGTCKYWVVTDIINSLRGLILFVIFFGNKSSVDKIRTKFSSMNEHLQNRLNQSMNSLRKLSLKPTVTVESGLESYKSDETTENTKKTDCPDTNGNKEASSPD